MIAVTPTYASIGIAAPILLGLARIIQGLSLGGEYGTRATYLAEVADKTSSIRTLLAYPREVLLVVGLTAGGTAAFYTYTTYMQKFFKLSVGLTDNQTTAVTAASLISR